MSVGAVSSSTDMSQFYYKAEMDSVNQLGSQQSQADDEIKKNDEGNFPTTENPN